MIDELLLDYKILLKNLLQMFANGVYMKKLVIKYSHSVHLVFDIRHRRFYYSESPLYNEKSNVFIDLLFD